MPRKKKEDDIKIKRYKVVDPEEQEDDDVEVCSMCPALRLVSIDMIPDEYLDLLHDEDLIKIRLGYDLEDSELFMCPVVYLCEMDDEDDIDEDDFETIDLGTSQIKIYLGDGE